MSSAVKYKIVLINLFFLVLLIPFLACNTSKSIKNKVKPDWVSQRPVNNFYYVGIGFASKINNPDDYQEVAKKNALSDMLGEIKVNVSSNSLLSRYQNNKDFSQQFFSDIKVMSQATIEEFEIVDSWTDKEQYWIYYKLSKSDYETYKRRQLQRATELSLDYLNRAENLDIKFDYIQQFRLRLRALIAMQNFLNEDAGIIYNGRKVYLVNEIVSQIQNQMYKVSVRTNHATIKAKVGKPVSEPINISVILNDTLSKKVFLPFIPLKLVVEQGKMEFGALSETNQAGEASFSISRVLAKDPVQRIRITLNIEEMLRGDSIIPSLKKMLTSMDAPATGIRVFVDPIRVLMTTEEKNLGAKLPFNIIEPALKKKLIENGCNFVSTLSEADYELRVVSDTKDLGVMWGTMMQSTFDMNISLIDAKNNAELFKDGIQGVRGFQTTPDKAGIDAYNNALNQFWKNVYQNLLGELIVNDR